MAGNADTIKDCRPTNGIEHTHPHDSKNTIKEKRETDTQNEAIA